MRIKITLSASSPGLIDFNYQHQIQGLIYSFLYKSDPDYSKWLHQQGFVYRNDKRFKLFVFSGIEFSGAVKILGSGDQRVKGLRVEPLKPFESFKPLNGFCFSHPISFQIASPVALFIQHLVDGIFKEGAEVRLGHQALNVTRVETLEDFSSRDSGFQGSILKPHESPIFVKKPMPAGERDIYLFPGDEGYNDLLNRNLMEKYETLYGCPYEGYPLLFDFQSEGVTGKAIKSFKVYKSGRITGEIKGTLLPFTVSGPEELIMIGLDCGFGQLNSMGCGYVVPAKRCSKDQGFKG